MRLSATRLFPLVLMLTLALLSFWLERASRESPASPVERSHDPDYSVERFTLTEFTDDGSVESTLSALKMVHYPDDDSTELVAPRLVYTRPDRADLRLSAERGTLSRDAAEAYLYDNVVLLRAATENSPEARLETTYLQVLRARSLVRTDRNVRMTERGRVLTGRGMEYDHESRQLSLFAQVRGDFEARP